MPRRELKSMTGLPPTTLDTALTAARAPPTERDPEPEEEPSGMGAESAPNSMLGVTATAMTAEPPIEELA